MNLPDDKTEMKREITGKTITAKSARAKNAGDSVLRVGIVGAGLMGKWHTSAAEKAGGKIVGVADADKNQAAFLAAKYRTAESFDGAAKMLGEKSFDVLHVCTPTASHKKIAELAIESGVNLFIEKPLAPSVEETIFLYNLAAKNNIRICPAHQFAFQKGVEKAKKMMPHIGKKIHLQATVCSAGGGANAPAEILDSIAADILPHPLSLFQFFLNELLPEENWRAFRPQRGELRIDGQAREISLSIFISMNARPTTNSFKIIGTRGTIQLDLFHGFAVTQDGKVSKARKILHPFDSAVRNFSAAAFNLLQRSVRFETAYPGLQQLVREFYQSIRENRESPISPVQAINVARVRDYLMQCAETNRFIDD